jgi:hypothetical protein
MRSSILIFQWSIYPFKMEYILHFFQEVYTTFYDGVCTTFFFQKLYTTFCDGVYTTFFA